MELTINGATRQVEAEADTPLLWVIRDELGMTGTKYGCGLAQCGACTVLVDGQPTRSCVTPVESVAGLPITTIEAIEEDRRERRRGADRAARLQLAPVEDPVRVRVISERKNGYFIR